MKSKDNAAPKQKFWRPKNILIILAVLVVLVVGGGAGVMKASDNPAFCTLCHNMQDYYDSYTLTMTSETSGEYTLLAKDHADEGYICHDCHEANIGEQISEGIKFVTGDYLDPLERRDFGDQICLDCHDFEEAKEITRERFAGVSAPPYDVANPHDSHNGDLDCNTCHRMHEPSQLLCAQCHEIKWVKEVLSDGGWIAKPTSEPPAVKRY